MLLKEVLEHLSYSEFAHIKLGGATLGSIEVADRPQIVSFINLGLSDLYKKFLLSEKEVIIQQFANISEYVIHSDNSVSKGTATYQYVKDTALIPFQDDLLKIEQVFAEDGVEYPLNDANDELAVFTTRYDTIQIQNPDDANAVSVTYRAKAVKLSTTAPDPDTMDVPLPDTLLTALLAFIAHRAHKPMASETNRAGSDYLGAYLALCAEAELYGTASNIVFENTHRFENNGWV